MHKYISSPARKQGELTREEIEKVRNNEDKESLITNIVFIYMVVYDLFLLLHFKNLSYLITPQQSTSRALCVVTLKTIIKHFQHSSQRHPVFN